MANELPKLITILGSTSSGKSSLAIKLALKYNGEIVSADSRQVFKKLDIGSGKVSAEEQSQIPHHLLDIVEPGNDFNVFNFQKLSFKAINQIISRKKQSFLVGGTALYLYSVIDNYKLSNTQPNIELRNKYKNTHTSKLQQKLGKHIKKIPPGDVQNPRRLIRALEKLEAGGTLTQEKGPQIYNNVILGIDVNRTDLYKKIDLRVDERIRQGMILEVEQLRKKGIKDEWLINLGLEYKWITQHLQGKLSLNDMTIQLKCAIHAYSKRQMTWFKRDKRIKWIKKEKTDQIVLEI